MDRLVKILADMVRSALAWEQEHGIQQNSAKINPVEPLTNIDGTYTVNIHEKTNKEAGYEYKHNSTKYAS